MKVDQLKAKATNYEVIAGEAVDLTGGPPKIEYQDERYYNVPEGRLKMRFFPDNTGRLMRYDKDLNRALVLKRLLAEKDTVILDLNAEEAKQLHEILASAFGLLGRVVKERHKYKRDDTFIYLDTVENLGRFVKVVHPLSGDWNHLDTHVVLNELLVELRVPVDEQIVGNYIDLINEN